MKHQHKTEIRKFLYERLFDKTEIRKFLYERLFDEGLRWDFADMCEQAGIDEFEAIETYEQEADRICKMFCLDAE